MADEIAGLRRAGLDVRVETAAWAREAADLTDPPPVTCLADDSPGRRVADLLWLATRRPGAVAADLRNRRTWARDEPVRPLRVLAPMVRRLARGGERHVHVHFAAGAALDALRMTRLAGTSYSVVAHAYEIYRRPANLREKVSGATAVGAVCEPAVDRLRQIAGPQRAARVHHVTMGVDPERFLRSSPYPGGRHVVAVGRLVEKKGFAHLLEAAALLQADDRGLDRVTVVGDGPLRADLDARATALGLAQTVRFVGAAQPAAVPAFLEEADVVAVPSVIAGDGDRDALPVVVQEALAMEVPVVASDLMGMPEVVRPPWGRLVPPGDPRALADALGGVLDEPTSTRAAWGRAGRDWVAAERSVDRAARRVADLLLRQ